jgi:uncharacterized membrane protein YfcA
MTILNLIIVFFTILAGSVAQAVSGFGMGVINVSVFPQIFPVSFSLMLSAILGSLSAFAISLRLRKYIQWKYVFLPLSGFAVPCALAVVFTMGAANELLTRILGAFLILLGIWYFFNKKEKRIRPTPLNAVLAGVVSGVLAGLFACGGPPMAIYYSSLDLEKQQYVGTIQGYFAISAGYSATCRILSGAFTCAAVPCAAAGIAAILIGSYFGVRLLRKVKPELVRKLLYGFIVLSGVTMLV